MYDVNGAFLVRLSFPPCAYYFPFFFCCASTKSLSHFLRSDFLTLFIFEWTVKTGNGIELLACLSLVSIRKFAPSLF